MARSYGFEADRRTHRPQEAEAIRAAVRRLLDDDEPTTLTALAAQMNEAGQLTATGRQWGVATLHRTLLWPRIAGLIDVGDGELRPDGSDPIITPEQRAELIERLARPEVAPQEPYLLTTIATCGLSGHLLVASKSYRKDGEGKKAAARAYVCPSPRAVQPNRRGCGRIRQLADPLEEYVAAQVLGRLMTPASAAVIAAAVQRAGTEREAVTAQIETATQRLTEIAQEWAYSGLPAEEARRIRTRLQQQVRDGKRQLKNLELLAGAPVFDQEHLAEHRPTRKVAGASRGADPETLAEWWESTTVPRRRALVALMAERIEVGPVRNRGAREFDEGRVTIVWR